MARLHLKNASVRFPIFDSRGQSFTNSLVKAVTGGKVGKDAQGTVTVEALKDVNLDLNDGDRLGVMGHNGAGKTTLLRLMAGIYEPSSGSVTRFGNIGSLIDIGLGINPDATGLENIELRSAIMGLPKKRLKQIHDDIIDFSELGDFAKLPVRTYSSGMQMRLAFSVATAIQPEILLMDEWLSVGDETFQKRAEERLEEIIGGANILVFATHSIEMAENLTSTRIRLNSGVATPYS